MANKIDTSSKNINQRINLNYSRYFGVIEHYSLHRALKIIVAVNENRILLVHSANDSVNMYIFFLFSKSVWQSETKLHILRSKVWRNALKDRGFICVYFIFLVITMVNINCGQNALIVWFRDTCMLLVWPGLHRSKEMQGLVRQKPRETQE